MDVKFMLDEKASARLTQWAKDEERTPDAQAKVALLKALELYTEFQLHTAATEKRRTQRNRKHKSPPERVNGAGVVTTHE